MKLAFVVGVPDEARGQQVVTLVVPWNHGPDSDDPQAPDGETLRKRLRQQLSSYKVPWHVLVISDAQIPWLVSQKADRRALAALAEKLVRDAIPKA